MLANTTWESLQRAGAILLCSFRSCEYFKGFEIKGKLDLQMLCFLVEALSIKAAPGFFSVASSASSYRRRFSPMPLLGVKKLVKQ